MVIAEDVEMISAVLRFSCAWVEPQSMKRIAMSIEGAKRMAMFLNRN